MGRSKRDQPITFVSAELPDSRLPRPLVPTDDVRVLLPDYEPRSERAARFYITPMGRVYRDDCKPGGTRREDAPRRPDPDTLKLGIGGGRLSRSLPRLVFRAFGRRSYLHTLTTRVVVTPTDRVRHRGQRIEWPIALDEIETPEGLRGWTIPETPNSCHDYGVRWVGEHKDENGEWVLTLTRTGRPEWWDVWLDPFAPVDEVTGARRCSVYDVALVPHGELIRLAQRGMTPRRIVYLVHPRSRKPIPTTPPTPSTSPNP